MSNILDEKERHGILQRIFKVTEESKRLWGRMSVTGMLCHAADQIRLATGEVTCKPMSNFVTRTLVKKLVFMGLPSPKGKLKTAPEIDAEIDGTKSQGLDKDIEALIEVINKLVEIDGSKPMPDHPVFGKMSKEDWGRISWIHLDFHLKQFGC